MRTLLLITLALCASLQAQTGFRPEFIAIHSATPLTTTPVKWKNPIYNLVGWKRADGSVVLPAIGRLALAGLTPSAAEDSVLRTYSAIIARPDLRVTALRRISVSGEVPRANVLYVDATFGLAEALASAGGVGPEGNRKKVELWRDGALVGTYDARSGAITSVPLQSGDLVLVARAGWWSRNPFVIVSLLSSAVSLIIALGQ